MGGKPSQLMRQHTILSAQTTAPKLQEKKGHFLVVVELKEEENAPSLPVATAAAAAAAGEPNTNQKRTSFKKRVEIRSQCRLFFEEFTWKKKRIFQSILILTENLDYLRNIF